MNDSDSELCSVPSDSDSDDQDCNDLGLRLRKDYADLIRSSTMPEPEKASVPRIAVEAPPTKARAPTHPSTQERSRQIHQ